MEIPEVAQPPELGDSMHHVIVVLPLEGRHVDVGETESLQVTHLTQERSKCGQGGQILGIDDRQKRLETESESIPDVPWISKSQTHISD